MIQNDMDLMKLVIETDEYKRAGSINEVRSVVRRVLRKHLIDLHISDSKDVRVREQIIIRHMELITLKILRDFDGIIMIPENYDRLVCFRP